jgi:hypothetical protein
LAELVTGADSAVAVPLVSGDSSVTAPPTDELIIATTATAADHGGHLSSRSSTPTQPINNTSPRVFLDEIWDIISTRTPVAMVDAGSEATLVEILEEEYGATDAADLVSFTEADLRRIAALFKKAKKLRIERAVNELIKMGAFINP